MESIYLANQIARPCICHYAGEALKTPTNSNNDPIPIPAVSRALIPTPPQAPAPNQTPAPTQGLLNRYIDEDPQKAINLALKLLVKG